MWKGIIETQGENWAQVGGKGPLGALLHIVCNGWEGWYGKGGRRAHWEELNGEPIDHGTVRVDDGSTVWEVCWNEPFGWFCHHGKGGCRVHGTSEGGVWNVRLTCCGWKRNRVHGTLVREDSLVPWDHLFTRYVNLFKQTANWFIILFVIHLSSIVEKLHQKLFDNYMIFI